MEVRVNFLISATFIKIRTSCALIRSLSRPNQMQLSNFIRTFWCASHCETPKADFICKTRETHNICVLPTTNINFRDKFPPEAAGQRKGRIFHEGFPPEGAHLLKADICRNEVPPEGICQTQDLTFLYTHTYTSMYPIAYPIASDIALVLLNLFRQP